MPAVNYNREIALLEPSLQDKAKEVSRDYNISMAKLIRMSLKYVLKDEKIFKQLLQQGDPPIIQEE